MKTIRWIETYMTQAEELIYDGHVEQALHILQNLLYDEPGYAPLHNLIGWAYMYHAKDELSAERHFRVAIKLGPDHAPPYLHMGTLLIQKGRYAEAIGFLRDGLTRPQAIQSALLEGIAQAHELRREYRKAIRIYKEAASKSIAEFEVDRMLMSAKRCRRKRFALNFSLW